VYRTEYVSYRQGPYRIRIVSAADRIVPALLFIFGGQVVLSEDATIVFKEVENASLDNVKLKKFVLENVFIY